MDIVWLDQPACHDRQLVGGKAANLSRLFHEFRIPNGFCLTAQAFTRLAASDPGMLDRLFDVVAPAYRELAERCAALDFSVAVRSSAIDEDSREASFAGQYETCLNVVGADAVAKGIARCWAAARSARVQEYRRQKGIASAQAPIAVLVQQLIRADVSAVVFSADPVTGSRAEIVINASWGLGESIVGGKVTPDTYRIRRADLVVRSREISEKRRMTVSLADATRDADVPSSMRVKPALDDGQAIELAWLAVALEAQMGWPVDIECSYQDRELYLLQCRPITTLRAVASTDRPATSLIETPATFPVVWERPEDANVYWLSDRLHLPDPLPLLEYEVFGSFYDCVNYAAGLYEWPIRFQTRRINGHLYFAVEQVSAPPEETAEQARRSEDKLDAILGRLREVWDTEALPEIKQYLAAWKAFDLRQASIEQLLIHLENTLIWNRRLGEIHFRVILPGYIAILLFDELYRDLFGGDRVFDAYRLLQGFDNKTLETDRALWDVSRKARRSPAVRHVLEENPPGAAVAALERSNEGQGFLTELRAYLEYYGHRRDRFSLIGPRWIEDPTPVIRNLKDYLSQPDRDLELEMAALAQERERLVAEARVRLKGRPQSLVDHFEFHLKAAQEGTVLSEDHEFWIDYGSLYQVRRVLIEFGRRFVEAGVLDEVEDVWHLTLEELRQAARSFPQLDRQLIRQRKAEIERFRGVAAPPELGTRSSSPPPDTPFMRTMSKFFGGTPQPQTEPNLLCGNAGSPGTARGPACVVRSLAEAGKLRKGDVLVTETTAAPWTALFATVAGVVTDTGGILSHCAVVAREYRIPAVVGTGTATSLIHDGEYLEVDGDAGRVRILSSARHNGNPREGS